MQQVLSVVHHRSARLQQGGQQRHDLQGIQPRHQQIPAQGNPKPVPRLRRQRHPGIARMQAQRSGMGRNPRLQLPGRRGLLPFPKGQQLRSLLRRSGRRGPAPILIDPPDQRKQLQLLQRRHRVFQVRQAAFFQAEGDRRIPVNGRQLLAESGLIRPGSQLFSQLSLDFPRMGQHLFQRAVLLQQPDRRFVSHPRHAGNIVAAVAGQALPVRHLLGGKSVFLINLLRRKANGFADALPGKHQLRPAADQLQRVPVPRQQQGRNPRLRPPQAQGAQQVIRLPALQGEAGNAHPVQQRPDGFQLLAQLRRGCAPPCLVFRINIVPEGRPVLVKADGQILNILLPDHLQQHAQEAVDRIGVNPVRVHQRQGMKRPVDQTVSVHNQEKILHG